ncbi:MAG: hypothetical protein J6F30_03900 [Cellulosilyticum sp.]|nr:hypothetical protein [Cellulosilyticum sp.]
MYLGSFVVTTFSVQNDGTIPAVVDSVTLNDEELSVPIKYICCAIYDEGKTKEINSSSNCP